MVWIGGQTDVHQQENYFNDGARVLQKKKDGPGVTTPRCDGKGVVNTQSGGLNRQEEKRTKGFDPGACIICLTMGH